jgi:hypothetical protein
VPVLALIAVLVLVAVPLGVYAGVVRIVRRLRPRFGRGA